MANTNSLNTHPRIVAELGPGDSLGVGLAALISGADQYFAFDVERYSNLDRNLDIFDELVSLFRAREDIPGEGEFPEVKPFLENYEFPTHIFPNGVLDKVLEGARIEKIRNSILKWNEEGSMIQYIVDRRDSRVPGRESIDMIYSQAVLEHVENLEGTYKSMYLYLKSDGFMSHQIDFRSHGTADEWNGHWTYSDLAWRLIRGRRPYLINRVPCSMHLGMLETSGFRVVTARRVRSKSGIRGRDLARKFRDISAEDLGTSGVLIQAVKWR